jgi:phage gpG-like protein
MFDRHVIDTFYQLLDGLEAGFRDWEGILREWGKYLRRKANQRFAEQGPGWPGLAKSTIEDREHRYTGRITKFGKVRASYEKNRARQIKGQILRALRRGEGRGLKGKTLGQTLGRYHQTTAALKRAAERQAKKKMEARRSGKTVAARQQEQRRPILGRLRSSLEAKSGDGRNVIVESRAPWSSVHNEGGTVGNGAQVPERQFLVIDDEDPEMLRRIAENRIEQKMRRYGK